MSKRMKLTVVFRDDEPLNVESPPTYRTVVLLLTDEQNRKLAPMEVGHFKGQPTYEKFAYCILEEAAND